MPDYENFPIGFRFKAWDGKIYVCESRDNAGLWMAEDGNPKNRRNVSERVIGRTFHHFEPRPVAATQKASIIES